MAGQGAHERPVAALGAQVGVDRPDHALDGGLRADPHEVRGEPGRGLQGLALVRPVGGLRHEDHVDVGDVVEFVSPALAHGDHRESALGGVGGRGGAGDGERGAQRGGGEVGQFGGGLRHVGRAAHVTGRYGEQAAPVGDPQRHGVDGLGEAPFELGDTGMQVRRLVGDQGVPVPGVAGQVVAERLGGAEHPEQPVPQRLRRDQGVQERLPLAGVLCLGRRHDPDEPGEGQIGVGGGAEGVQEHRIGPYGRQLGGLQEALGGRGIGEAMPQQSCEGTAPAPRHRHLAASHLVRPHSGPGPAAPARPIKPRIPSLAAVGARGPGEAVRGRCVRRPARPVRPLDTRPPSVTPASHIATGGRVGVVNRPSTAPSSRPQCPTWGDIRQIQGDQGHTICLRVQMNPILGPFVFLADQALTSPDRALTTGLGQEVLHALTRPQAARTERPYP